MHSQPKILTGVFAFAGAGFDQPSLLDASLVYRVPPDRRAQAIYLRAGNSSDELICLDSRIEVLVSAPAGTRGHVVLDLGFMEI